MNSSISVNSPQAPFQMVVLPIEPDFSVLANRAPLLSESSYMVATASSQPTVFDLHWMTGIYLVILGDTLGIPGLRIRRGSVALSADLRPGNRTSVRSSPLRRGC